MCIRDRQKWTRESRTHKDSKGVQNEDSKNESDLSPSPKKVRVQNEDSKNESDFYYINESESDFSE